MSPQTFIRDGCLTSTKLLSIQEDKRLNLFDTQLFPKSNGT